MKYIVCNAAEISNLACHYCSSSSSCVCWWTPCLCSTVQLSISIMPRTSVLFLQEFQAFQTDDEVSLPHIFFRTDALFDSLSQTENDPFTSLSCKLHNSMALMNIPCILKYVVATLCISSVWYLLRLTPIKHENTMYLYCNAVCHDYNEWLYI